MIDVLWVASVLLFVMGGVWSWRFSDIRRLDLAARLSIALSSGLVSGALVLYIESLAGIGWSRLTVALPLIALGAAAFVKRPPRPEDTSAPWTRGPAAAFTLLAAIAFYAAWSARMTIADLLFFWGPKAQHFLHHGGIDVEFLRFPHYYLMHPDYPPLLPMTWAASSVAVGRFSYWGAVLSAPLVLLAGALAFRGLASLRLPAGKASAFAALLLSVTTFTAVVEPIAGGGDPYLIFFETVALAALTFSDSRGARIVATTALAGAAFTKVEGAAFVCAVVAALLLARRVRTAVAVVAAPVALTGSWIAFARHHELLDAYSRAERTLHLSNVGLVIRTAAARVSYGFAYLPWLAALAPLAAARSFRPALFPAAVGLASIAYSLFFYLNEPDPVWWIRSSAGRVMITPLMCFVVASAAASE